MGGRQSGESEGEVTDNVWRGEVTEDMVLEGRASKQEKEASGGQWTGNADRRGHVVGKSEDVRTISASRRF